jgi:hypothetical protein
MMTRKLSRRFCSITSDDLMGFSQVACCLGRSPPRANEFRNKLFDQNRVRLLGWLESRAEFIVFNEALRQIANYRWKSRNKTKYSRFVHW